MHSMRQQYDGFWFPQSVRDELLTPERRFEVLHFRDGTLVPEAGSDTVTVRYPRMDLADWQRALEIVHRNRADVQGALHAERLPQAMAQLQALWAGSQSAIWRDVVQALETCTGHSAKMLDVALGLLELISVEDLQRAAAGQLTNEARGAFVSMNGLPGRVRLFTDELMSNLATQALWRFESYRNRSLKVKRQPTSMMLGYAAGNVPGTGLLLTLLGLATAAGTGEKPPVILIRNSRREPIFSALALSAIEMVDPALLNTTMVTVWDHGNRGLQEDLIATADLVIAAASDETIGELGTIVRRVSKRTKRIRFHRHGHKVSFSTIGRACLEMGRQVPGSEIELIDAVAYLAAIDVALWNQQGCLSSRVHFVEETRLSGTHSAEDYGRAVVQSLRELNQTMPKANTRRRQIHNLFDQYQAVAASNPLQVLSEYDDDFLVILDRRDLSGEQFRELVNGCQGRTVAIVPVTDLMEVPHCYLKHVGRQHLQSMSVAVGDPDTTETDAELLQYAEALGAMGIASIRTVGRGAFPQLAYSWDGLLPLDLVASRQRGYFTAIEFSEPWAQIYETYSLIKQATQGRTLGL
jgi:hypothetical protein